MLVNSAPLRLLRRVPHSRVGPKEKTTSSAVITSPLWKRTPSRRSSSTVRSSMRRQAVARPGFSDEIAEPIGVDQRLGVGAG